ncbi:SPOR domain-containing protein [Alloprevotella sp. OH1205_COT-284]|uniref:SPOR domain-containing protein n=1 Tax=Alloprevotella sp. OH1205_COT-284 TaxID=2491043 RepID=UPI000F5F7C89|nr:SPOR domain-containing protein [Alloprevotella sp. OH1205_COT-284]RRD78506.1 SPOR domain-containing protein [Alloprevotella sp. OH1205_COT-284]
MKTHAFLALSLCTVALFSACGSSQESAYRRAYEKAKAQEQKNATQTVTVAPAEKQEVTPVATTPVVVEEDNTPVRTIPGGVTVVNGEPLKAFSVVTGSFINQTNAEGMMTTLRNRGYAARVVKTNETISGHTGWYRVIASSFDSKAQAVQSKNTLRDTYPDAWLLSR